MVSAPTNHEVAGFMPGRLEFEHEVDNDAELVVKDMEFGLVWKYGGDEQPQARVTRPPDEEEGDDEESQDAKGDEVVVKDEPGTPNAERSSRQGSATNTKKAAKPELEIEDEDELEVKLALLDIYFSKLDKREEAKDLIFDRGLTDYKRVGNTSWGEAQHQIQASERKRPKDERDLITRNKVYAKLQTAQDFEVFVEGLTCERRVHCCS